MGDAVPEVADLQVVEPLWTQLKRWVPVQEVDEVYRLIGPVLIDDNDCLHNERASLVDILRSYREETDHMVANKRAAHSTLCRRAPQRELLQQQLRALLQGGVEAKAPTLSANDKAVADYVLNVDLLQRRPASARSRRPGSADSSSLASSRPTSLSSSISSRSFEGCTSPSAVSLGGTTAADLSEYRNDLSVASLEKMRRFEAVLEDVRGCFRREQMLLEEDIEWLHDLLGDEMAYHARAASYTEPSLADMANLKTALEHELQQQQWIDRLRHLPDASQKKRASRLGDYADPLRSPNKEPLPAMRKRTYGSGGLAAVIAARRRSDPNGPVPSPPGKARRREGEGERPPQNPPTDPAEEAREWLELAASFGNDQTEGRAAVVEALDRQHQRRGATPAEKFDLGIDIDLADSD